MAKTELKWLEINPEMLLPDAQAAYAKYKEAYRMAKACKDAFEQIARSGLPNPGEGKEIKFGYNFGKLSIAVGDAKAKATPDKPDLMSFIKGT